MGGDLRSSRESVSNGSNLHDDRKEDIFITRMFIPFTLRKYTEGSVATFVKAPGSCPNAQQQNTSRFVSFYGWDLHSLDTGRINLKVCNELVWRLDKQPQMNLSGPRQA